MKRNESFSKFYVLSPFHTIEVPGFLLEIWGKKMKDSRGSPGATQEGGGAKRKRKKESSF